MYLLADRQLGDFKFKVFGPRPTEGGNEAQKKPQLTNMLQAHVMSW